jgi:hypothetical protein
MKTLLLILSITLFSCGEDIKLSTLDGHKKAILIDKYP